jgi:ABC-type transport system involved in multi-copper enzyme maturation permease subunit
MGGAFIWASWSSWLQPVWMVAVGALGVIVALWAISSMIRVMAPRVAAVARTTAKEAMAQPLFYVLQAVGVFLLLLFVVLPYNTFGEDIKMVKDQGFVLIKLLAMVLALWTAGVSIADEIEGRTALTLLSKPVGRREFILGKLLGILLPVAIVFLVLGLVFLTTVSYKVVYDARETAQLPPGWRDCWREVIQTIPGLVLAFMETVLMTSIGVAISTRLPMLPNLIICLSIYILGHLVPLLLNTAVGQFEIVAFAARFFSTVFPVLDHYNIEPAIATGQEVPLVYLGTAALNTVLYSAIAMLAAMLMFEDRDLA